MYVFESKLEGETIFACMMTCQPCEGRNRDGSICKKTTCIGLDLCWIHLLREKKVRIKESLIPNAGKGLFALDEKAGENAIVFKENQSITAYGGEVLTHDVLNQRYGDGNASYAISRGKYVEDAACKRGVGSLINHASLQKKPNARLSFNTRTKRFVIVANKNIRNGSEILVSYGKAYLHNDNLSHKTSYKKRNYKL